VPPRRTQFEIRRAPQGTTPPPLATVAAHGLGPRSARGVGAFAWISDTGHYGAYAQDAGLRVDDFEDTADDLVAALRGAFKAVNSLWPAEPATRLRLLLSPTAAGYAESWRTGGARMPAGYEARPGFTLPDLAKLASALRARADRVRVEATTAGILPDAAASLTRLAVQIHREGTAAHENGRQLIQVRAQTALRDLGPGD
jgi:hypothetical protein